MNKIVENISNYFGGNSLEHYQVLTKRDIRSTSLDYTIASMAVFHDTLSRPRDIDLKQI